MWLTTGYGSLSMSPSVYSFSSEPLRDREVEMKDPEVVTLYSRVTSKIALFSFTHPQLSPPFGTLVPMTL